MGVYLSLKIMPGMIEPKLWEETFDESVKLLKAYPDELMSFNMEKLEEGRRWIYSRQLLFEKGSEKEYWNVGGDIKSRESGETFILYRNINQYGGLSLRKKTVDGKRDILCEGEDSSLVRIAFNEKTQGRKYHIPLLATAALIEDRIPYHTLVGGDIDFFQSKKAVEWASKMLGREIKIPVQVDAPRIWKRLCCFFSGGELMDRFYGIFLGETENCLEQIVNSVEREEILRWLAGRLTDHECTTLGAISWFVSWLNATKDLKGLIEACCFMEEGPRFDPIELARSLAACWIGIPLAETEPLEILQSSPDRIPTPEEQLAMFFVATSLTGLKRKVYWEPKEILGVFEEFFPEKIKEIEEVFIARTEKGREALKENIRGLENFNKIYEEKERIGKEDDKVGSIKVRDLKMLALCVLRLQIGLEEHHGGIPCKNRTEIWRTVIAMMEELSFVLTEDAWSWIDREWTEDQLRIILLVGAINQKRELTMRKLQREVFEDKMVFQRLYELYLEEKSRCKTKDEIAKAMDEFTGNS